MMKFIHRTLNVIDILASQPHIFNWAPYTIENIYVCADEKTSYLGIIF